MHCSATSSPQICWSVAAGHWTRYPIPLVHTLVGSNARIASDEVILVCTWRVVFAWNLLFSHSVIGWTWNSRGMLIRQTWKPLLSSAIHTKLPHTHRKSYIATHYIAGHMQKGYTRLLLHTVKYRYNMPVFVRFSFHVKKEVSPSLCPYESIHFQHHMSFSTKEHHLLCLAFSGRIHQLASLDGSSITMTLAASILYGSVWLDLVYLSSNHKQKESVFVYPEHRSDAF